jgi:hypothetical protein
LTKAASRHRWEIWATATIGVSTCSTRKGPDWLGAQDAIEYMCREAVPAVLELNRKDFRDRSMMRLTRPGPT